MWIWIGGILLLLAGCASRTVTHDPAHEPKIYSTTQDPPILRHDR